LQVEHPVTELVTGEDLVAWQLSVAQGEPLPRAQEQIELRGHAIEARLYAEDPAQGFLPQLGPVHHFFAPTSARVRVDAGVQTGGEITSFYDPMVAKIIGHGPDRSAAIRALTGALRRTTLLGPTTNRDFLLQLCGSELFAGASFKTDTLDRGGVKLYVNEGVPAQSWAIAAAMRVVGRADGWRSTGASQWPLTLRNGEVERSFDVERRGNALVVRPVVDHAAGPDDEGPWTVALVAREGFDCRIEIDGVQRTVVCAHVGDTVHLDDRGHDVTLVEPTAASVYAGAVSDGTVAAPIGGKVLAVDVSQGEAVTPGQRLCTVESMKIEHRVEAPIAGLVSGFTVQPGDQVAAGQRLCTIEVISEPQQGES
jgi:acetyl/propionyl-CoA carboxylase alpha subunit